MIPDTPPFPNSPTASYVGLAVSVGPYVVPPHIRNWDASSLPDSQLFLLTGMMFLIPTILAYTAFSYWVFPRQGDRGDRISLIIANRTWPIESGKEAKPLMFNGCKCEGLHYTIVARRPPNL